MAVTENLHTGNGSKTNYSFTFPYLKTTDIKASVDGTVVTNFTAGSPTATEIQFNTAPANNAAIRIYRDTATENLSATFYAGSAIKSEDLNDNFLQNLYVTQEAKRDADAAWQDGDETINSSETWHTSDDTKIATTKAIEGRIDTKIDSALTDDVIGGQSVTVADNTPSSGKITVSVTAGSIRGTELASNAVNGDKIADDSIDSEHYVDGSIDTAHIADGQITHVKLGADCVDGDNIQDNVINSEHYAAGSIDTEHLADAQVTHTKLSNDCIDGDNIQNDVINSEHYAAGSIDTEHIADANVTLAKIENVADTKIIVGNGSNRPTAVTVSGDVTIANTGAVTIANNAITEAKISDQEVTTAKLADGELRTLAGMQSGTASILAGSTALTATTAELNILDNKSFRASGDGALSTTSDTEIPSSKVIANHVAAQIGTVGGFTTIATEVAFPATASQPASGVIVSISDAAGIVVNGSGVSTTGRTTDGTPATVTINSFPSSLNGETLASGVGLLVTSTGSSNTYTYHKLLAAENDVKQLSDDINDFNARYRVAGSAPGSDNDEGDLYFDTSANKMKVYNGSSWDDVASVGNFYINTISSSSNTGGGSATFNGSAYRFTLSNPPTMAQQLIVSVNGVLQKPDAGSSQPSEGFAINGNDIIFSAAPASGSDYFIVTQGSSVSIGTPSDNTVSTAKIQNLAVDNTKIANDSIAEVKLDIHNAPGTDKYLKYTSNGMEWSDGASEGTDVKSTGESGTTKFLRVDGDGTCSWQIPPTLTLVDEDDMASNSATSVPSQQSVKAYVDNNTGSSLTLVADGAIAAGKPCVITTAGKAAQITETFVPDDPPVNKGLGGSRLYFSSDFQHWIASDYGADTPNNTSTGLTLNCWHDSDSYIRYRFTHWDSGDTHTGGFGTGTISSSGNSSGHGPIHCRYIGDGYWLVMWPTGNGSTDAMYCRTVHHNGDLGTENTIAGGSYGGTFFDAVRISDTRTVVTWRSKNSSVGGDGYAVTRVLDWSGSGTSRTFSAGSNIDSSGTAVDDDQYPSLAYDSSNSRILLMNTIGGAQKIKAGTISGSAGSGTISWGSYTELDSDAHNGSVTYDATNNKTVAIWKAGGASAAGYLEACVITTSNSDNSISAGTVATSNAQQDGNDGMNSSAVAANGLFTRTYMWNTNAQLKSLTVSGTTVTWQSGGTSMSNTGSKYPIVNYNSKKKLFEVFREKTNGHELYGNLATTEESSNNNSNTTFIGFAPSAISDGATGKINLDGNTVGGQSSLTIGTRYYVANDGTLTTTHGTNHGGLAIAADTLLIKDGRSSV